MNKALIKAAKDLYNTVQMPVGTFNVIPLHTKLDDHLEVWVDKQYLKSTIKIPQNYLGFKVIIKEKPLVTAHT